MGGAGDSLPQSSWTRRHLASEAKGTTNSTASMNLLRMFVVLDGGLAARAGREVLPQAQATLGRRYRCAGQRVVREEVTRPAVDRHALVRHRQGLVVGNRDVVGAAVRRSPRRGRRGK